MADFLQYEINEQQFNAFLREALKVTDDLRPAFGSIANDFFRSEKLIFKLKSPGGYKDIKESTKRQKRRSVGFIYPILKRSGKLEKSITQKGAPGNIFKLGKQSLVIGTDIEYGLFHQVGTRKMPVRKFVFIDGGGPAFPNSRVFQGRSERWTAIVANYINQVNEQKGFTS